MSQSIETMKRRGAACVEEFKIAGVKGAADGHKEDA